MARIIALLVMALVLSGCGTSVREGGDPHAKELKAEVDAVAQEVVPALTDALDVVPTGLQAHFTERGGWGLWDYNASGQFLRPVGTKASMTEAIRAALTDAGLKVEADSLGVVTGTKDNVFVRLTVTKSVMAGGGRRVNLVDISIGSAKPTSEGDDFAETVPAEDYLAYLK